MELPILLVLGAFVAILVIAGIIYSISEFQKMKKSNEKDKDGDRRKPDH